MNFLLLSRNTFDHHKKWGLHKSNNNQVTLYFYFYLRWEFSVVNPCSQLMLIKTYVLNRSFYTNRFCKI